MDICFLPAWFYDMEGNGGGIFFREQAVALREEVTTMSIFYPLFQTDYLGKETWSMEEEQGIAIFKYQGFAFPKRVSSLLGFYRRGICRAFATFLAQRDGKLPDLIHAHSLWGAYAAMTIKHRWGIPFIYTEHLGKWTQEDYELPSHQLKQLLKIGAAASVVTAVSSTLAQGMHTFLGKEIALITPNMVDTTVFYPAKSNSLKPDQFNLISIGDPWHTKGLDVLIQAMGVAQQQTEIKLQLTLVDKIPGREHLSALIRQYHLADRITFAGRLDRPALCELLQAQDLLVSASRIESFGITMIEGMACGLPVLATRTAGAQDIVRPFCGTLVALDDVEQLADGLLDMIDKRYQYDRAQLASYVRTTYGKVAFTTRWRQIYSSILSQD